MIRHFVDWFSVQLHHGYYADGKLKALSLTPSSSTNHLMRQYELVWGSQRGVFSMKYATKDRRSSTLELLQGAQILRFYIRCGDPYFNNITQIPFFNPTSKILYLSNVKSNSSEASTTVLSAETKVGAQDLLPVRNTRFDFEAPDGVILSLRDAQNQIVPLGALPESPLPWTLANPTEQPHLFQVNLDGFPAGKYGLELQPDHISWFFLQDSERQLDCIGVVDILVNYEQKGLNLPDPNDPEVLANMPFLVSFEARKLPWRYVLINRSKIPYDELMVFNVEASSFTFQKAALFRNEETIVCYSDQPLALQEQQTLKPKLKVIKQNGNLSFNPGPLIVDLPTPDVKILARKDSEKNQTAEEPEVYSNMYIYL
jgi:hypothetical protein